MVRKIMITKASGELQEFSQEKLRRSLERSGAESMLADEIVEHISGQVYDSLSTKVIRARALAMLKTHRKSYAARYNLKRAIAALGPSGFPFEQYVARLFDAMGYTTSVGVILRGKCISHEVDVILAKGDIRGLVECKFHALPGMKCDVKIPLYIHSRFQDIEASEDQGKPQEREGWVVTNTRFTDAASAYGSCVGLKMLGWNTGPLGESMERLVDTRGLHPVTCLTSITAERKRQLLADGVVLCQDLLKKADAIDAKAIAEAEELCKHAVYAGTH